MILPIRRINLPFVAHLLGLMCWIECIFLLLSVLVSVVWSDIALYPLLITLGVSFVLGGVLVLLGRHSKEDRLGRREAMLVVALTWLLIALIGMLPYLLGGYRSDLFQAFFESMSAITTTGATTFSSVENLPEGLLFWRSIGQWQGGIGIVVFSLALSPVVGREMGLLYKAEVTGIEHDRFMPMIKEVAIRLSTIYLILTAVLAVLLLFTPMYWFDAMCFAMTCISTGGFSNYDEGIVHFDSVYAEVVLMLFMTISSISLSSIYFAFRGRVKQLWRDEQTRWYLAIILVISLAVSLSLWYYSVEPSFGSAMRKSFFQIISMISTTGYTYGDYSGWGSFFMMCALFAMLVCGCSGSTSGGAKVVRFMVMAKTMGHEVSHRIEPSRITPLKINGVSVRKEVVYKVMSFFFAYIGLIFLGAVLMTTTGNDMVSALSACVSVTGNAGPALGNYVMNYSTAHSLDLMVMSLLMLVGRLEIFTVLSIFTPIFWRK